MIRERTPTSARSLRPLFIFMFPSSIWECAARQEATPRGDFRPKFALSHSGTAIRNLSVMAKFHLLNAGYVGGRVASTVSLIEARAALIVVDPGMVASTSLILDPIWRLGRSAGEVTDVILSHHHPDHTINIALFPEARVHDHWAVYRGDVWESRPAEGYEVTDGVVLWETPGHTPQDITTIIRVDDGDTVAP